LIKEKIPNILSISRIILSVLLIPFFQNPQVFISLYLLVGLTDVLDGYLARRYKTESALGARLDSIGDFIFYVILVIYLILFYGRVFVFYWVPIVLIFVLRISNILIGFLKHKKLTMLHTVANKITGIMVFVLPIMLTLGLKEYIIIPTIIVAFLASIEELIIILRCKRGNIDLNRKHL